MVNKFIVHTRFRIDIIDITREISKIVKESTVTYGVCYIFIPHTTASITINENADPDVVADIKKELEKVVPLDDNYSHSEGNSAAHIKASLLGSSETIFNALQTFCVLQFSFCITFLAAFFMIYPADFKNCF